MQLIVKLGRADVRRSRVCPSPDTGAGACFTDRVTERDGPPPLHFGDYPQRTYWSADTSPDDVDEENYEVSGTVIRFMPDVTVTVPLWDAGGLLPEESTWLNQALGLSAELVADIAAWGEDWNTAGSGGQRFTHEQHRQRPRRLRTEAETLVERLRAELPPGFTVTLQL